MKIDGSVLPADEQQQQANIALLTNEDLRILEQLRLSGDLKVLQQYITVLEKAVPSLKHSQQHEVNNARLQRIAYLRQVLSFLS
jgi:hypothetical protein